MKQIAAFGGCLYLTLALIFTFNGAVAQEFDFDAAMEAGYLPPDQVDAYVTRAQYFIDNTYFQVDGQNMDIEAVDVQDDFLVFVVADYIFVVQGDEGMFENERVDPTDFIIILRPNGESVVEYENATLRQRDQGVIAFDATIEGGGQLSFALSPFESIGLGTSQLRVEGRTAYLNGELGTKTYIQIRDAIRTHDIDTLVLEQVNGSVNDLINVHTGRLVRQAGITTVVKADSSIASGGVDLFSSGAERIVYAGATIGVHSWCCGPNGETAIELDKDDPAHRSQIEYFTAMLGDTGGRDFYFFTLQAAPFDGIHPMTRQELETYALATEYRD